MGPNLKFLLRMQMSCTVFCVCVSRHVQIKRSKRQVMSTVCGHIFCNTCIKAAIRTSSVCPTCRHKLTAKSIHQLFL